MQGWASHLLTSIFRFQSNAPHAWCNGNCSGIPNSSDYFNQRTPCGVQRGQMSHTFTSPFIYFNQRTPCGCNSKTIQSKCVLIARRVYIFANYVLHILKHLPTYCIGTTLQPLNFGAKLPAFLCQLKVRTNSITLL